MKYSVAALSFLTGASLYAQVTITKEFIPGAAKPIFISISGLSGEALQVLQFDLYVQGFATTNAEAAQYLITGSNNGNLQARATDAINKKTLVSKSYSGAALRRQAHAFADDFLQALNRKGIAQTKIAFKGELGKGGEIFISDFDGFNSQEVTRDNALVAAPSFVPGRLAVYYVSYVRKHPDIFYQDLSTGARKVFAGFGGSNISPAAGPDGRVAMVLSKDGWTDLYVANADGSNLKRLTTSPQDESSPCWSPDGKWICFAGKEKERRALYKIPSTGGSIQAISTGGVGLPTEPDWSPDGEWIAFTAQFRNSFQIYVVPAKGGVATSLVEGEDPSWSANSRTLVYCRRRAGGGAYTLSLLDVPTKQYKDVSRISGSNSQSQPSWAK